MGALRTTRMSGAGEQTDILSVADVVRERWRVVSEMTGEHAHTLIY